MDIVINSGGYPLNEEDKNYINRKVENFQHLNQKIHRCEIIIREENNASAPLLVEMKIFGATPSPIFLSKNGKTLREAFDKLVGSAKRRITDKEKHK